MSKELNETVNEKIKEAEYLIGHGKYGLAYRLLLEAQSAATLAGFYEGLETIEKLDQENRNASRKHIQEAKKQLDALLADNFDIYQADEILELWRLALLSEIDTEWNLYRNRVDSRHRDAVEIKVTEDLRQKLEALYRQAEAGNLTTQLRGELYERAYKLAELAATEHPDIAPLQMEVVRANRRRDSMAKQAEMMLSGALADDYVKVLNYIRETDADIPIEVFDRFGGSLGLMDKQAATLEIYNQSKIIVEERLIDYAEDARGHLDNVHPRAAQAALDRRKKFDELVRLVPGLIADDRRRRLDELQRDISKDLSLLEEIEQTIEKARSSLEESTEKKPLVAYRTFQKAYERYAGTKFSDIIRNARDYITQEMRYYLQERYEHFSSLGRQMQFNDAISESNRLLSEYAVVDGFIIDDLLEAIRSLNKSLQDEFQIIETTFAELESIRDRLDEDQEKALTDLRELERRTNKAVFSFDEAKYNRIRSEINQRVDIRGELKTLATALDNPNLRTVEQILTQVRTSVKDPHNQAYRNDFEILELQLEAYLVLLQSEQIVRREGYRAAIQRLESYSRKEALGTKLKKQLEDRLSQLNQEAISTGEIRDKLNNAKSLLENGFAYESYEQLRKLENFDDVTTRLEHGELLREAQQKYIQKIEDDLKKISIDTVFDINDVAEKLNSLDSLDMERSETWRKRLDIYVRAQEARESEKKDKRREALEIWVEISKRVRINEAPYVRQVMNKLEIRIKESEKDELLNRWERINRDNSDEMDAWFTDLTAASREFDKLINRTDTLEDKIRYALWRIDLELTHGQYSSDTANRRNRFDIVQAVGRQLKDWVQQLERESRSSAKKDDAAYEITKTDPFEREKSYIALAEVATEIGQARQRLETDLTIDSSLDLFQEAFEKWQSIFVRYSAKFSALRNWYQEYKANLERSLAERISESDISDQAIILGAKLLILDPKHKVGLSTLKKLKPVTDKLFQDVDSLEQELSNGGGDAAADTKVVLAQQLKEVNDLYAYTKLIRQLVERFETLLDNRDRMALRENCSDLLERAEKIQKQLLDLQRLGASALANIDKYQLPQGENNPWHKYEDSFKLIVRVFEEQLSILQNHPYVDYIHKVADLKNAKLKHLVEALKGLQDSLENEDFTRAEQLVSNAMVEHGNLFVGMELYDSFTVPDKFNQSRISGWEKIKEIICLRFDALNILQAWARPFGVIIVNLTVRSDGPSDVINWTEWKQKILREEVEKGNFEIARKKVYSLINGADANLKFSEMAINAAISASATAPIKFVANPQAKHEFHNSGRSILAMNLQEQVELRHNLYQQVAVDAEAFVKEITQRENKFKQHKDDFSKLLMKIIEHQKIRPAFFLPQGDWNNEKSRLLSQGTSFLDQMRKSAREHKDILTLETNPIWKDAFKN